ncbi:MAG: DUF2085 domain-containing protein [Chitinophagales bacterium]|nr:DUF2085 domain-containing protein [Chitinophagales bacterium]MCB9021013.1 DUF2085 domain-containing protein [Chitinophagales bacterium]HPR29247.1 DUF2085 domain-containing protein [Chitinophagales bacterium]HQU40759.1 DUF2085 domain-containing protein [Chitinophagales bacterium]HQU77459.1 DUF2085 domain-containing protein [Chitinophagales bacterium]
MKITAYHLGCHGIPERCLVINGRRMHICARCAGSNIGHIIALVMVIARIIPAWWVSLLMLGVMMTDWSLQTFANIPSNNTRRLITGILGGIGVGLLIWTGLMLLISYLTRLFY